MKKLLTLLLLTISLSAFRGGPTAYVADRTATKLTWTGHAEVGDWAPTGTLQLRQGTAQVTGTTVQAAHFEFAMNTITYEHPDLQRHLRGADFFDVARFPTAVFELKAVRAGRATGELTIKGTRRTITFPIEVTSTSTGLRVRGTATVDRTQFGIRYNSVSFFADLGDYAIRNDFQLAFDVVLTPSAQP